jgi:nucleotide-binding universal stress UspA family protein
MYNPILHPLFGWARAEATLPHALALAQLAAAELILLQIVEERAGVRSIDPLESHLQHATAQSYLAQTSRQLQACGVACDYLLEAGSPVERIVQQADLLGVDLILLSSHGQSGRSDTALGSVAHALLEHLGSSGMLVRALPEPGHAFAPARYRTILVPLDGSRRAESVLPIANRLAVLQDAELVLAHVVHRPALLSWALLPSEDQALGEQWMELNQTMAERYLAQLQARQEARTTVALAQADNVAIELHRMVEQHQADLVLVSAHGAGANPLRLFGDTLNNILTYCAQPVLVYQDLPRLRTSKSQTAPQREHAGAHELAGYP